ncbi:MAG: DHH family phosphoesterase [Desulfovibrionaceae bacterium]|nr:DHH family phosphoesterase [Desulfovibrionaceae bacterium]
MFNDLLSIVKDGRIFIQPHDYPDPDAIASAFGLHYFLQHFGIETGICFVGDAERVVVNNAIKEFNIPIMNNDALKAIQSTDKIILVDGQKLNSNMTNLPGDEVACIDHHPIFKKITYQYADIRLVGSCSSIIADYFFNANFEIPVNIATLLLHGLMIDTKNMTRGVAELDLEVFPKLYRLADHDRLSKLGAKSLEFNDLQAFGAAINNIKVFSHTGFAGIPFPCPDALIAQVADFILSLAEVDIAIIHDVREAGFKFSVKSVLPEIHSGYMLSNVMPPYGSGGGHAKMAAGFISKESQLKSGLDEFQFMGMLARRFLRYITEHLVPKNVNSA